MASFFHRLLHFLFPSRCYCCEKFLGEGQQGICPDCLCKIQWIEPPFCSICGTPFVSKEADTHPCGSCITHKKYFTIARALGCYEGPLRTAIHRWKYQEKTPLTSFFGERMEKGLYRYWDPPPFDLLIPVPLHPKRLRERGFNQSLLLVKELSHRTGIPYEKRLLQKKRQTLPQVELSGREREKEVRNSFRIIKREALRGKTILLVDDVYTTGATVNECAKVLLAAGAERIDVFTIAHAIKTS